MNITEPSNLGANNELMNVTKNKMLISNEKLYFFMLVNMWGFGQAVCVFGVLSNIINIIIFAKQGVRDTVNTSLLGLATSDLGSQITLFYANISFSPLFTALDLPFVVYDFMYLISWCHIMFTRTSTLITAYITLERCLCVTAPLKIKHLFTPKRAILYFTLVYILMIASISPCFYTIRPALKFDPVRNKTLFGISFIEDRDTIESVAFLTNNTIPLVALCLVVICTAVLVTTLRRKSKWRQRATNSNVTTNTVVRENKVVKMVVLISAIFIICNFPASVAFLYMLYDQDMRIDGVRRNLLTGVFSFLFHLESINAGVNIFIYFSLSSKFKSTFVNMLSLNKKE